MKPMQAMESLTLAIADAARTSFRTLFENGERYYYCTLYTTGEGHAPSLSAWSWEALEREAARQGEESGAPEATIAELIKWSYADSPYCCYGDENFGGVKQLFMEVMPPDKINTEIALRLNHADSPAMQAWLAEAAE
ncbi:DUF4303 domain-containing protein [Paenibacillus sp. LMG 31459]|uniref:DUF4303 domain-containing protein n=1 Tax=Paenibacillus phytohabitans TaxID=2654978 RepID=A0ABX1YJ00_9BACL|nr:DUF4303 domain-containing protein [Paenibacillus phytohabitans]NOU79936.1 DUF4303 domain-containing protein [Paenibacillus phytohabitans]